MHMRAHDCILRQRGQINSLHCWHIWEGVGLYGEAWASRADLAQAQHC